MKFQKGNQFAARPRIWGDAIRRVVTQNPDKVRAACEKLLDAAAAGDIDAVKELGNRLDGKPMQMFEGSIEHRTVRVKDAQTLKQALDAALQGRSRRPTSRRTVQ